MSVARCNKNHGILSYEKIIIIIREKASFKRGNLLSAFQPRRRQTSETTLGFFKQLY